MIPAGWPLPLVLLVRLLRAGGGAEQEQEPAGDGVPALAARLSPAGWQALAELAIERHQVAPAAAAGLERLAGFAPDAVPDTVRGRLAGAVRRNALATALHVAETRRIAAALADAGIGLTVFKGWPLAQRLYGRAEARQVGDLDLLVPVGRVADSRAALEGAGFEVAAHSPRFRRRLRGLDNPRLIRACKDIEMVRPETGVVVELHWRLLDFHGWPLLVDRPGALTVQETEAGRLAVPDDRTNLLYLSTHGSLHLWDRLKWLDDIARLARARGPDRLGGDLGAAREAGLERPVALALALAARLLASPLPEGLAPGPAVARLERWILARMARPPGRFAHLGYQAGIRRMGLALARDWRQALGILGYDTLRRLDLLALARSAPRKR